MSASSPSPGPGPALDLAAEERVLLVVDDERPILESLAGVFRGSYRMVQAESGADALRLLQDGLRPQVILSDNRMPGLTGVEFLLQSAALAPDAVRAVMTAHADLRDILAAIARGHVYLYLTKPWQVSELVQAVHLCFQQHDLLREVRRAAAEVEAQSQVLKTVQRDLAEANKGYIDQNRALVSQLAQTSREFAGVFERGAYHVPHAEFVGRLARAVAYVAGFSEPGIAEVEIAALLHDIGKAGLPRAADPDALAQGERALYESHVERGVRFLDGVEHFEKVRDVVARHHERPDGRGFPFQLEGREVCRESQIVALADFYHNQAYRLTPAEERLRRAGEKPVLTREDREARQAAAATRFADIAGLYDPRVVQAFHDVSAAGTVDGFRLLPV